MTPPVRQRPPRGPHHPATEHPHTRSNPVIEQTSVLPIPVRPIPGLGLAFFTGRLAPPTTTVPPTSPLFRPPLTTPTVQEQGLQPIATPTQTVPETPPRTEEERLERQFKTELRRLRSLVQTSRGRTLLQAQSRLQRFEEVERHLETLKIHGQTRRILRTLLDEGHRRLIQAAVRNNNEDFQQGTHIATAIQAYHRMEERAAAVVETVAQFYPPTTTRGIRLEYTGHESNSRGEPAGHGNYEPPLEVLQNLTIVRTYRSLCNSSNPEERIMAESIQRIVGDINAPGMMSDPDNVEFLEQETTRLQGIYGAPENPATDHLGHFFTRVHQTQLQDLERNPAYQNRQALQASLENAEVLSRSLQILERNTGPVSESALTQTNVQLLQIARRAHERIAASLRQLEARRPTQIVRYQEDGHWITDEVPSHNPAPEEQSLSSRLERLNGEIQQLEHFDATAPDATGRVQRHMRILMGYEEEIVQSHLREEARLTGNTNFARVLEARLSSDPLQRIEYYRNTLHRSDVSLLRQTVQARIAMYRSMIPAVRSADRSLDRMGHLGGSSGYDTTGDYTTLIERYEHAQALVEANQTEAAQRELTTLEQAQIGTQLQDRFETSGHINMGVSLGVMAASAFSMNVAGLALLPELALSAEVAEAAWTTRLGYTALTVPIFRMSHNVMHDYMTGDSTVWDSTTSVEQNMDRYGRALMGDIGAFMTLGTVMRGFQRATQARMMHIAENQLLAEGTMQSGPRSLAEMTLISSRAAQIAQGLGTRAALTGGSFGTELTAIQAWGFLDANFQNALEARFVPLETLNQTVLNPQAWQEQAVFILGMRAGHSLTNPLFGPINEVAREAAIGRIRNEYDQTMIRVRTAGESWRNYVENREGNPVEVLRALKEALEARQRLAENPALQGAVDLRSYAATQQTLDVVRAHLTRVQTPETQETHPLYSFSIVGEAFRMVPGIVAGLMLGAGGGGFFQPAVMRRRPARNMVSPDPTGQDNANIGGVPVRFNRVTREGQLRTFQWQLIPEGRGEGGRTVRVRRGDEIIRDGDLQDGDVIEVRVPGIIGERTESEHVFRVPGVHIVPDPYSESPTMIGRERVRESTHFDDPLISGNHLEARGTTHINPDGSESHILQVRNRGRNGSFVEVNGQWVQITQDNPNVPEIQRGIIHPGEVRRFRIGSSYVEVENPVSPQQPDQLPAGIYRQPGRPLLQPGRHLFIKAGFPNHPPEMAPRLPEEVEVFGIRFRSSVYNPDHARVWDNVFRAAIDAPNAETVRVQFSSFNRIADDRVFIMSIPRTEALELGWIVPTMYGYRGNPRLVSTLFSPNNRPEVAPPPRAEPSTPVVPVQSPAETRVPAEPIPMGPESGIERIHISALHEHQPMDPVRGTATIVIKAESGTYEGFVANIENRNGVWTFVPSDHQRGRPVVLVNRRVLATSNPQRLNLNDTIEIGGAHFRFEERDGRPQLTPLNSMSTVYR